MTRRPTAPPTVAMFVAAACLALPGCFSGHGKYTKEHVTLAQARLDTLKAATEYGMAEQAFLAGDLEKADKMLRKTVALAPEMVRAHVLRGRVELERGDLGAALRTLEHARTLDGADIDAAYYAGVVLERLRRTDEALAAFSTAAEREPYDARHVIAASEMLIDLDRPDEAEAILGASPASQTSAGVRQMLGHIAMMRGDAAEAADRFAEARLLAPEEPGLIEDLVRAQMQAGLYRDAEINIARLRRRTENGERRDLRHAHAACALALGRPAEARALYRGLTLDAEGASDTDAWTGLGETAYLLGDASEVRRCAARLVATDPKLPSGYTLFAMHHLLAGRPAEAVTAADDGLTRAGEDVGLLSVRAVALARSGMGVEADATVSRVEAIDRDAAVRLRASAIAGGYAGVTTD